jgi:hypothetical protein
MMARSSAAFNSMPRFSLATAHRRTALYALQAQSPIQVSQGSHQVVILIDKMDAARFSR